MGLDSSPFAGSIARINLKSGCGLILIDFPLIDPLSLIVSTPFGSKSAFKRSSTDALHKLTLSIKSQFPCFNEFTNIESIHSNEPFNLMSSFAIDFSELISRFKLLICSFSSVCFNLSKILLNNSNLFLIDWLSTDTNPIFEY